MEKKQKNTGEIQGELKSRAKKNSQIKSVKPRNPSAPRAKIHKSNNVNDQLANLLAYVNDAIVASDAEYRLTAWNAAAESMYGWKADEVLGRNSIDVFQTIFPDADEAQMLKSIDETAQYRGEATQVRKDGTRFPVDISSIVLRDEEGQITGYVSVNRDVTDRKQMEEFLRQSALQNSAILETALDGFWLVDPNTQRIIDVNDAYCRMSGYSREELLQMTVAELEALEPTENVQAHIQRVIDLGADRFETVHRRKDGSTYPLEIGVQYLSATGKNFAFLHDMTSAKQAKEALQKSEERYRRLADNVPDIIFRYALSPVPILEYINPAVERITGYSPEECYADPLLMLNMAHPEDVSIMAGLMQSLGSFEESVIMRWIGKDGVVRWMETRFTPIYNSAGELEAVEGLTRDITERKKAEEELRKSNERFQWAMHASQDGLWDWDISTGEVFYSPSYFTMLGYLPDKLPAHVNTWTELIHPDDRQKTLNANTDCIENRCERFEVEFRMLASDGSWKWILGRGQAVRRDEQGKALRMVGTHTDITERKRAEEALQVKEYAIESSINAIAMSSLDGKLTYVNPAFLNLWGYDDKQDILGRSVTDFWYSQGKFVLEAVQKQGGWIGEMVAIRKDGSARMVEVAASMVMDSTGKPLCLLGAFEDITERKRAEDELRESQQRFASAFEFASIGMALVSPEGGWLKVNQAVCDMLGYSEQELLSTTFQALTHPDDLNADLEYVRQMLYGEITTYQMQKRYFHKSGDIVWALLSVSLIHDESGKPQYFISQLVDITERKQVEDALRKNEEKLRTVFNTMEEGVALNEMIFDENGEAVDYRILEVNPAYEEIAFLTREQAVGKTATEIYFMEPAQINAFWKAHQHDEHAIKTDMYIPEIKKWRHISTSKVSGNKFATLFFDNTEQKNMETALRESEVKLKSIFDNSRDAIGVSHKGIHVLVNPAYVSIFGYENAEEIVGLPVLDLIAPESRDGVLKNIQARIKGEDAPTEYEVTALRKDGSTFIMNVHASTYILEDEQYTIVIMRDVTEHKRADNIMQARLRLMQFAPAHSFEELLRATLDEIETLTGSLIGFYHTIEFDQKTIVLQTWSTNTLDHMCNADAMFTHYPIEQAGVWADCVHERRPVIHNDYASLPASRRKGLPDGHAPVIRDLAVPIMRNDRVVAIIGMGNKLQEYDANDVEVVSLIADLAWDITDQKRAEEHIQEQLKHLQSLHIIDNAINSSFDLNATLNILIAQVILELKVDAVSILLFNKQSLTLEYAASQGFHSNVLHYSKIQLGQGYAGQAIRDGRAIHIPDLTREKGKLSQSLLQAKEHFVAYYGLPLFAKGQVVGVIEIFHRSLLTPTQEWLDFLDTLAGQAAIAINNVQLFTEMQRSNVNLALAYDATIEGWSHAMDLRDRETEGHTQRVTDLTLKLARVMNIPESDIVHLYRGSLLHDIGKMGVPDAILFKPGPLDEQERKIMRQHPVYAYEMLVSIDYLKPTLDIPHYHHERWDGTGYPSELKGTDIPLAARIFAVVDVWDAVTSDRPYRAAWSKEKALDHIKSGSGSHFDPDVVIAFLGLIEPMLN